MEDLIVFLRSNPVNPDSRVEKEVDSLLKVYPNRVIVVAWDRKETFNNKNEILKLQNTETRIIRIGEKASFGDGFKNIIPFIKFQYRLMTWLIKNRKSIKLIHACDFDTAFSASLVNKIIKKIFIFDIFDYLSTDAKTVLQKILKKAEDNIINNSTATIICTEQRKMQISDANPKSLTVIHNSPYMIDIKNNNYKSAVNKKMKIAYVGILQDNRLLIEIGQVVSERDDIELHIGGFGKYEEYFKKLSNKCSNVYFYGKLSYNETLKLENSCDIMVAIYDPKIGNHKYAAPNKFYEALMLGKPLIMVNGTGMSSLLKDKGIGVLINYSKEGFNNGIEEIMKLMPYKKEIAKKMKSLYDEEFSWNEMENRLQNLYKNLLNEEDFDE
ncbi:glycosyltransferase [[Eubacterium] hominis]|uniref:glycosyltransferase n=1 Tax=[Eubacterium] hominis TaxID=2764325 RepID=UPI0022E1C477